MRLIELKEQIETGKTAKLFVPKTHENGVDLTIRVQKIEDDFIWQRGEIKEVGLPPLVEKYLDWQALMVGISGMESRDATWELCDEKIEVPTK